MSLRPPSQIQGQGAPPTGPGLSRLHLAAALIEYDNEDDPDRYRSHRDSAIFRPFQSRPPDQHQHQHQQQQQLTPQPQHQPHQDERQRPPSISASRPGSYAGPSASGIDTLHNRPQARDSATMEILEGRHRRSGSQGLQSTAEEGDGDLVEDLDVSRWGLPDHLISKDDPTPPTQQRSRSSMSTSRIPPPQSSSRPTSSLSPSVRRQSRPFPVGPPSQGQGQGDINTIDGLAADDEYGIASALESAERIRRLVAGDGDGDGSGSGRERERTRSGGEIGLRPTTRADRRVSFNELELHDRPSTSMGLMSTSPRSSRGQRSSLDMNRDRPSGSRSSMSMSMYNPTMVPLPTSPGYDGRSQSRQSSFLASIPHVTEDITEDLEELHATDLEPNPFAMPAPPPEWGSRFDPKQLATQRSQSSLSRPGHGRVQSNISQGYRQSSYNDNSYRDPNTRPTSMYPESTMGGRPGSMFPDEKDITEYTRADPASHVKVFDEVPTAEQYGKPLKPAKYTNSRPTRLSRHDLLRPKTLVMPSSLADIPPPQIAPKKWEIAPEGFSIGEKPLPAGARTSVLTIGGVAHIPLSLSQRTFRSSLLVGGQRGEAWVGGAEVDGEVAIGKKEREGLSEEMMERRPGKLYGKSLIDQLEARKQAMKGKQRQFQGDHRPAMMARNSSGPEPSTSPTTRKGPLLHFDADGNLHESPTKPGYPGDPNSTQPLSPNSRRPLSQMPSLQPPSRPIDRLTKSTSVFGVDEIWAKEMAKLKIIQAEEAALRQLEQEEADEKERKKQEKKAKKEKKTKGKDKYKTNGQGQGQGQGQEYASISLHDDPTADFEGLASPQGFEMSPIKKSGDLPPMVQFSPEKPPPRPVAVPIAQTGELGNSDHEEHVTGQRGDERHTGVPQPRYEQSDSDDDIPLSRIKRTTPAKSKIQRPQPPAESSDDEDADIPLSQLRKAKAKSPPRTLPTTSMSPDKPILSLNTDFNPLPSDELLTTGSLGLTVPVSDARTLQVLAQTTTDRPTITQPTGAEEEDDDVPLLLRQAHIKSTTTGTGAKGDDDDDVPLGIRQSMRHSSYNSFQGQGQMVPQIPHPGSFMPHNPYSPYPQQPQYPQYPHPQHLQQWPHQHQPYPPQQYMGMGMGYPGTPGNGYPPFQPPPPQMHIPNMNMMGNGNIPAPMGPPMPGVSAPAPVPGMAGMAGMPSMTMPPLPDFGLMDPTGTGPQHDNIDNWRKAIATPGSVSGESKA